MSFESCTDHIESVELGLKQRRFAKHLDWVECVLLRDGPECEEACREVSISPYDPPLWGGQLLISRSGTQRKSVRTL